MKLECPDAANKQLILIGRFFLTTVAQSCLITQLSFFKQQKETLYLVMFVL